MTWKAVLIGLALIPLNAYWTVRSETAGPIFYSTTSSLFCNVVFLLFGLTLINEATRRAFRRSVLAPGELLVVYSTLSVAAALSGESVGQQLVRLLSAPFWLATPENDWATLFHRYLPGWLVVDDKRTLIAFFEGTGDTSLLYTREHLMIWVRPLLLWCGFISLLVFLMTCLNVVVRKQWIEHERLTYPVIQLPLGIASQERGLLSNSAMWAGFALAASITLLNGLHTLVPVVPGIRNVNDINPWFVSKPWDAMQPMVIAFYPCAVGLAYFMPLDLAFSTWFFFFFWKAQLVGGGILGLRSLPGFPYAQWQQTGGYLAIGALAVWVSRRQISHVFRCAWKETSDNSSASEPMNYRTAVFGLLVGFALLFAFGTRMGMTLWVAVCFFGIYFLLSVAITRMRAELGPLVHELYYSNAGQVMTAVLGVRRIPPGSLTSMSLLWWLTRSQNSHVMPHQLEAFKLSERTGIDLRRLWILLLFAAVFGAFACSVAVLHTGYRYGGSEGFAMEAFGRLQSWLENPRSVDIPASVFMGVGFLFALVLFWLKRRFLWWSLHPLGYAVTQGDWAITFIWFPIFVSWLLKWCILKYGGLRSHRNSIPFFLGLILGDFVMGAIWGLVGLTTGLPIYRFKNW